MATWDKSKGLGGVNVPIQFKLGTEYTPDLSIFRKTKKHFLHPWGSIPGCLKIPHFYFFLPLIGHQCCPVTSPKTSSLTIPEKPRPETLKKSNLQLCEGYGGQSQSSKWFTWQQAGVSFWLWCHVTWQVAIKINLLKSQSSNVVLLGFFFHERKTRCSRSVSFMSSLNPTRQVFADAPLKKDTTDVTGSPSETLACVRARSVPCMPTSWAVGTQCIVNTV